MALPKPAGEYSREEMRVLLAEGATFEGYTPYQAAAHILIFLDLPPAWLTRYVTVDEKWSMTHSRAMMVALVTNWAGMIKDRRMGDNEQRMLTIAASLAAGRKISLGDVLHSGLGVEHARAIAEAMFIRCGLETTLTVQHGGPGWDRLQAIRSQALASGLPPMYTLSLTDLRAEGDQHE